MLHIYSISPILNVTNTMPAELGFLSLTQQKLAQSQQNHHHHHHQNPSSTSGSWMLNPNGTTQDDDDSWEVRAFAEDTSNIDGTTWPPRSYTCTFCRREFRSAQALGGHMNVHRRDRAKLHQALPRSSKLPTSSSTPSSTLLIPNQKIVNNGGLYFLYSLPNPNSVFSPTLGTNGMDSPSTLLSISPHHTNNSPHNNLISRCPPSINSSDLCHSSNSEPSTWVSNHYNKHGNCNRDIDFAIEELDLELRLGRRSSPS